MEKDLTKMTKKEITDYISGEKEREKEELEMLNSERRNNYLGGFPLTPIETKKCNDEINELRNNHYQERIDFQKAYLGNILNDLTQMVGREIIETPQCLDRVEKGIDSTLLLIKQHLVNTLKSSVKDYEWYYKHWLEYKKENK